MRKVQPQNLPLPRAEDYAFFEELPIDMQREEEEASQAQQLLLHASEGQACSTNEASTSGTLLDVPSMDIWSLPPLMVEGQQYLFLHDIETLFNLREDEALGVLCGFDVDTSLEEPGMLDYSEQSLEEYLATTRGNHEIRRHSYLRCIAGCYPHTPSSISRTHASFQGSINIAQEEAMDRDQADTVSITESFL